MNDQITKLASLLLDDPGLWKFFVKKHVGSRAMVRAAYLIRAAPSLIEGCEELLKASGIPEDPDAAGWDEAEKSAARKIRKAIAEAKRSQGMDSKHKFCRLLLKEVMKEVMKDVQKHTSTEERKKAWAWHLERGRVEFHGPNGFYWYGQACCLWAARAKGWEAYLGNVEAE